MFQGTPTRVLNGGEIIDLALSEPLQPYRPIAEVERSGAVTELALRFQFAESVSHLFHFFNMR